jgi:hypothetical protein
MLLVLIFKLTGNKATNNNTQHIQQNFYQNTQQNNTQTPTKLQPIYSSYAAAVTNSPRGVVVVDSYNSSSDHLR